MSVKQNKWCFVPRCESTSIRTPNKIFITVPRNFEYKKKWFKAARRDMPKSKTVFFCCEDHFDVSATHFKVFKCSVIFLVGEGYGELFAFQISRREDSYETRCHSTYI